MVIDTGFRYTPSDRTDIRKTFARVREEIAAGVRLPNGTPIGGFRPLLPAQKAVQRRLFEEARHGR